MRNWDTRDESGTDEGCEWKRDWEDVQRVCRMLDLPCEMVRCLMKSMEGCIIADVDVVYFVGCLD